MNEFGRKAFGPGGRREPGRSFVTSGTVVTRRFQILPMTIKAGIVIGKISHVREISFGIPRGRNFVATIARQALVLIR